MRKSRIMAIVLTAAVQVVPLAAQSAPAKPAWESLMRAPVPEGSLANISVVSIPVAPAPSVPRDPGPGHTHPGPVFAYILQGKIENQVEPDPPYIYAAGDYFQEVPMHVHRFLRNLSATEPAKLIIFQEGADNSKAAPGIKMLIEEPLPSTTNQEVILLRLTLPAGTVSEGREHSGPAFVYVVDGKIETSGTAHAAGDLFLDPANPKGLTYKNASNSDPAKLLVYYVSEKRGQ
jgi:quercetin dioxygenase-like cupin family protein